jgi:hypothetical protein
MGEMRTAVASRPLMAVNGAGRVVASRLQRASPRPLAFRKRQLEVDMSNRWKRIGYASLDWLHRIRHTKRWNELSDEEKLERLRERI